MKKLIISFITLMLMVPSATFATNETVTVIIPEYDVTINGHTIDIEHSQYPIFRYADVTYFPMTYEFNVGLGLNSGYDYRGLRIDRAEKPGILNHDLLGANNQLGSSRQAKIVDYQVKVNGEVINTHHEKYPILAYKDITYFPIIWKYAVDEFNWITTWSAITGLDIQVNGAPEKSEPVIDQDSESIKKTTDAITSINEDMLINGKSIAVKGFSIDLNNSDITMKSTLANNTIGQTQTLEEMALENNAVLAINGSYFNAYVEDDSPKDPYGILIVDGVLTHNGNDRATIAFKQGAVDIDRVNVSITGENSYKGVDYGWFGYWMNHTTSENGINLTIFDEHRGSETQAYFGTNYVVENDTITKIIKNQSVEIPEGGYVVNLNGQLGANMTQVYDRFKLGYTFDYTHKLLADNSDQQDYWESVDYATSAGPALILDGEIDIDFVGEYFYEPKILTSVAARSAIGYTEDNQLFVITTTATVYELAEIMDTLGCYEAMNLDGGASSGLWYDGSYVREPGRALSNMIYVEIN